PDGGVASAPGRSRGHAHLRLPFEADDVVAMVRKVFAGRVRFHDGDDEIAPGITVHRIGGHSEGLQSVRVKTRRGYVVLASGASHLDQHIDEARVFPIVYNTGDVLAGYETLKRLATARGHIISRHAPNLVARHPRARRGLDGWAVRLDADPVRPR